MNVADLPALHAYRTMAHTLFQDELEGIYLTGSAALGGYHAGKSDIDCTVLLEYPLGAEHLESVRTLHRQIARDYPASPLECQYLTRADLGKKPDEAAPFYSYHDGTLKLGTFNASPVTWYTLKTHGVTAFGTPIETVPIIVTAGDLQAYVLGNVNAYWRAWLARSKGILTKGGVYALTGQSVEWGAAGISRMYYTLTRGGIVSKDDALVFSLEHFPEHECILREALYLRTGDGKRQYFSPFLRRRALLEYLAAAIEKCNTVRSVEP